MKDIRLCGIGDGRIGVFSRPQGKRGGRGQIGYALAPSLEAVPDVINNAPLLNLFSPKEWGGVNQAVLLEGGAIGLLGHIACFSGRKIRHYYPMTFILDAETGKPLRPPRILVERACLLPGEAKRPDLQDVIFPGGISIRDGTALLYLGVGDMEAQTLEIPDPFI
jgi:hypothetical protein